MGTPKTTSTSLFTRHPNNPLLTPEEWPYPVNAVMNAAATTVDGQTVLLCRVEDHRGLSHLCCARSEDGVTNWVVDPQPSLASDDERPEEEWGLEDPRVTHVRLCSDYPPKNGCESTATRGGARRAQ